MERTLQRAKLACTIALLLAASSVLGARGGSAQAPPEPPAVAKECGDARIPSAPLPNSATALQQHKRIRILAIGALSSAVLGAGRSGNPPLLERILERTIKGLDVEIVNRGFSGELAEAAAERIKIEVALNSPDIVLWQVGTNDALAHVPVEHFHLAVGNGVRWLKAHNVDVILVGLHYMKQLVKDPHYQGIRRSLARIGTEENVLRIGRYEAMEVLAQTMTAAGQPQEQDFGLTEAGYNCMAQYIARTIAVGVFAKAPRRAPPSAPPQ
jgi:lysophospholipase L1-like esterase